MSSEVDQPAVQRFREFQTGINKLFDLSIDLRNRLGHWQLLWKILLLKYTERQKKKHTIRSNLMSYVMILSVFLQNFDKLFYVTMHFETLNKTLNMVFGGNFFLL